MPPFRPSSGPPSNCKTGHYEPVLTALPACIDLRVGVGRFCFCGTDGTVRDSSEVVSNRPLARLPHVSPYALVPAARQPAAGRLCVRRSSGVDRRVAATTPVKVVVPFGAGGGSDTFARIVQRPSAISICSPSRWSLSTSPVPVRPSAAAG